MLYVYGPLMPVRILEEIIFWKTQENEHTAVIQAIIPQLEEPYVKLLNEWAIVFGTTEAATRQHLDDLLKTSTPGLGIPDSPTEQLLRISCNQSHEFIRHLYAVMAESDAAKVQPLSGTVLLHIIRESEYFLGVLEGLASPGILRQVLQSSDQASKLDESNPELPIAPSSGVRAETSVPIGGHRLPPLPYPYNALEPYIDEETMRIHHDKHHQSYVDGLNQAEIKLAEARKSGNYELIKHWERELAFHGGGHYLHTIFWNVMSPQGGGRPTGALLDSIERSFGSYDRFKQQFSEAANKVEGVGWAILVWSPRSRRLEILMAEKHQNLSQWDVIPLLTLDVWEHAYYLKHQNKRADYIKDWWQVVNWTHVSERYTEASKLTWQPY